MSLRLTAAAAAAALSALALGPGQALADVTVIGNGLAADCSRAAKAMSNNQGVRAEAVQLCTLALENESLTPHETAATFVNRGVLYLGGRTFDAALRDFAEALKIEPMLAEAHVNRGAALIGKGQDAEGVAEIDKGLALNTTEPEKAYFNRAVAEERQGDLKSAYLDYRKALELKPDWDLPKTELARFRLVPK
jgi:tetratricopeptide (TPR) repeat protein